MSREKMLQAEVALKNEQLTDLTKEVERLRRQAEESGKRAQTAVGNESKIAELKQTIGKLAPVAKKVVQYAAELQEARRRLAVVEKERSELSKNYSVTDGQTAALKSALAEAQSDVLRFDTERKAAARRAKKANAAAKRAARQKLIIVVAAVLVCAGTISGSYAYVAAALKPPAELSEEAAAAFKQYAPEFRRVVELAVQNERESLAAERNRYQQERIK
jgi:predicted nuclease with TOPRIM domain